MNKKDTDSNNIVVKSAMTSRPWWLYLGLIALSCSCIVGGAKLSQLGMDWGYYLVERFIGQPASDDQAWGAGYLMMLAAPAVYGAIAISTLTKILGGRWRWRLLLPALLIVGFSFADPSNSSNWSNFLYELPRYMAVWLVAVSLSFGFDRLYLRLVQHVNAEIVLTSLLIAVLPTLFLDTARGTHYILFEIVVYFILLFIAAFWAPLSIRTFKEPLASYAMLFALSPILVFNLVNIIFATVCAISGKGIGLNIGWTALLSAVLIQLVSILAITFGAGCGSAVTRLRVRAGNR